MYLLDANVFIQAKDQYYDFEVFPGFWEWIIKEHKSNRMASIRNVKVEILKKEDSLSEWIKKLPEEFFIQIDINLFKKEIRNLTELIDDHYEKQYQEKFFKGADFYLVAQAKKLNATLVTQEAYIKREGKIKHAGKIRIPNVCSEYGVRSINTFKLLQEIAPKFVLE